METLVFETALGFAAFARHNGQVQTLSFGHARDRSAINTIRKKLTIWAKENQPGLSFSHAEFVHPGEDALADRLTAFASGERTTFDDVEIAADHLTAFGRKVIAACRKIDWGQTLTYGQLAHLAGRPGAARAVGSAMARNRVPLIVPCHRVVPASGGLGGFSAPQGVTMKRQLLELEQQIPELLHK